MPDFGGEEAPATESRMPIYYMSQRGSYEGIDET